MRSRIFDQKVMFEVDLASGTDDEIAESLKGGFTTVA
jgi:hypothetical protein